MVLTATLRKHNQMIEGVPVCTVQMRMCLGVMTKTTRNYTGRFVRLEVIDVVNWYF